MRIKFPSLQSVFLALLLIWQASAANAQEAWPMRPVRVVIPFLAGGGGDAVGRAVAQAMTERLGRPFVADNRPGGASSLGTELVARAAPDGYTILIAGPNHATNPHLMRLAFDTVRDFAPVSLLTTAPYVMVANPQLPVRGLQDLLALARQKPGELTFGSAGNGTAGHLAMEMIKATTGVDMQHVPYRGSPPVLIDIMAGRISVALDNVLSSSSAIAEGRMRALAVTGANRNARLPEVPTVAEQGLPGFDVTVWQGALFPAGTPQPIVQRLSTEIASAMREPALRNRLSEIGVDALGSTPEAFRLFIDAELTRWGDVIRRTGTRLD